MMSDPIRANKGDLIIGAVAAAAVIGSGLMMGQLRSIAPDFASIAAPIYGAAEIVSQNAVTPDARNDLPAIASCPISLELMDEGRATIGGTLLSPCNPSQDLVIAHAGMVISAKTLASGALFFSLPALEHPAQVDIRFSSGEVASAEVAIPDVRSVQRVAVQWPDADGFTLHAFENGAEFGAAGHIWAQNPALPDLGAALRSGYLTALGDASTAMPLMAQVFTYGPAAQTDVQLEAAVTDNTCDSEVMGDIIAANFGQVSATEVSVAMPDCSAVGEFVQLGAIRRDQDLALLN
ncbi:MAG: hypothetical protein U5N55_10585 [Cypionkella sp.]|nr:hypothetical protein [Cypionkella sp.]